ncbi:DNA-directed RNA polymerase subunit beta, partial [Dissostichus eleginoides]
HPSLSPPILSDWRLVLSREAEAQTQTWSRTSVKSHVFITGFVLMMGLGGADWQPCTLPPCLSLLEKLTTAGMFILMRLGVEEAPTVCSSHGTPIWSLAGLIKQTAFSKRRGEINGGREEERVCS